MYSEKTLIEAENVTHDVMVIDSLVKSEKKEKHFKTLEDIDSKPTNTVIEKLPDSIYNVALLSSQDHTNPFRLNVISLDAANLLATTHSFISFNKLIVP